jgi:cyclopropane-fatty-acyl-phospholipid synthase
MLKMSAGVILTAILPRLRGYWHQNGVALIHSIGVHHNAKRCNRWLNKYILPGGYIPSLEQMMLAAGHQELKILDMEIMRGHYAETLK